MQIAYIWEWGEKNVTTNFLGHISVFCPSLLFSGSVRGWAHASLFQTGHIALKVFVQIKLHLCRWCFHVWVSEDGANDSTKWLLWWQLYCGEKRRLPGSTRGSSDISQYFGNIYIEVREVEMGLRMFCWCRVVARRRDFVFDIRENTRILTD